MCPMAHFSIDSFASGRRKTVMIAAEKSHTPEKSHTRFFGAVGAKSAPTWREK